MRCNARNKERNELKALEISRRECLMRYQLVADFAKQLSIFYEKSPGLFTECVDKKLFANAVSDMDTLVSWNMSLSREIAGKC